jgi:hypothetical protein
MARTNDRKSYSASVQKELSCHRFLDQGRIAPGILLRAPASSYHRNVEWKPRGFSQLQDKLVCSENQPLAISKEPG